MSRTASSFAARILLRLVLAATLPAAAAAAQLPDDFALPSPPGPHVAIQDRSGPAPPSFRSGSPLVATSYFYWYDAPSKAHVVDPDGSDALTDHPPALDGFSFRSVDWHARQLEDMIAAGVDVLLPVYWGEPSDPGSWSDAGVPVLVAARERLLAAGKAPPAIGMFYDTSTLQWNRRGARIDLRTGAGKRWFFGSIRDFWSLVPPQDRAAIDGRPLVFLYAPAFAAGVDDRLFPDVRKMFEAAFGAGVYLVAMDGWPEGADARYNWGGALAPQFRDAAAIGPGYDHAAVEGRAPLVRDREGGRFYRRAWDRLLAKDPATRPWLVHLETWNEFHEGTEICESREHGRLYLEITRTCADLFHARRRIERPAPSLDAVAGRPGAASGVVAHPLPDGDGPVSEGDVAGARAWTTSRNRFSGNRYLYFDVDDGFLFDGDETVEVVVEYLDRGPPAWSFQYDSADPAVAGLAQAFREGHVATLAGTGEWKAATFTVPHARFAGGSNGADFRLACHGADLSIRSVALRRPARR